MTFTTFQARPFMKLPLWLAAIGLMLSLTGCFDIEETISLNRDGSGNYQMVFDMSEMGDMIKSMQEAQAEGEGNEMSDAFGAMDSVMEAQMATVREIAGISNVSYAAEGFKFTYSYDFENVDALNEAQAAQSEGESNEFMQFSQGANYTWKKGLFERVNAPIEEALDALGEEGEEAEAGIEMAKMMFGSASYTTVCVFPGKVKKASNENAEIMADKRTVKTKISLADMLSGEANVGNKIKYKR